MLNAQMEAAKNYGEFALELARITIVTSSVATMTTSIRAY